MCYERETGVKEDSRQLEGRVAGEDKEFSVGHGALKMLSDAHLHLLTRSWIYKSGV